MYTPRPCNPEKASAKSTKIYYKLLTAEHTDEHGAAEHAAECRAATHECTSLCASRVASVATKVPPCPSLPVPPTANLIDVVVHGRQASELSAHPEPHNTGRCGDVVRQTHRVRRSSACGAFFYFEPWVRRTAFEWWWAQPATAGPECTGGSQSSRRLKARALGRPPEISRSFHDQHAVCGPTPTACRPRRPGVARRPHDRLSPAMLGGS